MYYEKAEHTEWVFGMDNWQRGLIRVDYVMVKSDSNDYKSAVENSNLQFWADKQKQLMKEFKRFRMHECIICYETQPGYNMAIDCKTCKNSMCLKCSHEYSCTNHGKFPFTCNENGYNVLLPCPMCRTENLYSF